jgi:hypothetical protein
MGKQSSNGVGAAVAVVFTALVAVSALCIASPQAHELYGQVVDGFLHEELDGIRDFLRQPTWAGLRGGAAEVSLGGSAALSQPSQPDSSCPACRPAIGLDLRALSYTPQVWSIIGPGGRLHPSWFLEHKGHLVLEGLLIVVIAVMLLQSRFNPKATEDDDGLTEKV